MRAGRAGKVDQRMKTVFTTGEAAKICKVSQQTIIRCFDNGQLKGFRVPGSRFRRIPREMLYIADEIFLTGTAAELTPVREVDHRQIGEGRRGPVAEELQKAFFDVVTGKDRKHKHWLTPVPMKKKK